MRKSGKEQKQNKIVRIITTPIRVLVKAKDMYVRSITKCGNNMNYSNPTGRFENLPRSYSAVTSRSGGGGDNEDFAELMRAASARTLGNRIDMDLVLKQHQELEAKPVSSNGLPKSVSVGMGRIDEEKPSDDMGEGDVPVVVNSYPRSRSYAVGKRNVVL